MSGFLSLEGVRKEFNGVVAVDTFDLDVDVSITNDRTGHHVPTGVTVRNMILLVDAWRGEDGLPLADDGAQVVHDLGGIGDPADGYYAGLPGKLFAKVPQGAGGEAPVFFTDATGILFDNRIPALATDVSHYTFAVPPGGGTLHVRARLVYRRAFRAYSRAIELVPDDPQLLNDTAVLLHYHLDEYDAALAMYARSIELAESVLAEPALPPPERERFETSLKDAKENQTALLEYLDRRRPQGAFETELDRSE